MKHNINKVLLILFALSLALACTISSPTSNSIQAEATASQGSALIAATSSPIPEVIPIPTPTAGTCMVSTGLEDGTVNLRSCDGTACSVLAIVTEGESLDIITAGETTGYALLWMNVTTADGVTGWINSNYCEVRQ
jgi:uncharacterized protein YgiM (DUF1202 family)